MGSLRKFFIFLIFLLVTSTAMAENKCQRLFTESRAAVFVLGGQDEIDETSQDGPAYFNPTLDQWFSSERSLSTKNLTLESSSGNGRVQENVLELSGVYKKIPFEIRSGGGHGLQPSTLNGRNGFGNSTGIQLRISAREPHTRVTIYIRAESDGRKTGPNHVMAASFEAGPQVENIYLPWDQFIYTPKLTTSIGSSPKNRKMEDSHDTFGLLIEAPSNENSNSKTAQPFTLRIHGPIVYERDIMGSKKLLETILNADHSVGQAMSQVPRFAQDWGFPRDGRTYKSDRALLEKAFEGLHNPEIQKRVAALPSEKLKEVLKAEGYDFFIIDGKLEVNLFFNTGSPLSYIVGVIGEDGIRRSPYVESGKHTPVIPFETGEFALEHGEDSHAQQVLAMIWMLKPKQRGHFKGFYGSLFGNNSRRWAYWDIIFDAPGNTFPNAPRFWRDLTTRLRQDAN